MVESLTGFPLWILGTSFLYAVLATFRFSVSLGIIERPLAVAFIFGLLGGHWEASIGVGVFFELLWLDLFPAGTYIPPHGTAATLGTLTLLHFSGLFSPGELPLPLAGGILFGLAGTRLEYLLRRRENFTHAALLRWGRRIHGSKALGEKGPELLVLRSWGTAVLIHLAFFLLGFMVLASILELLIGEGIGVAPASIQWFHLWLFSTVGGLLSLRAKKGYGLLVTCLALTTAFMLLS